MCVSTRNKEHLRPLGELQGACTLGCQARTGSNDLVLRTLVWRSHQWVRGALALGGSRRSGASHLCLHTGVLKGPTSVQAPKATEWLRANALALRACIKFIIQRISAEKSFVEKARYRVRFFTYLTSKSRNP